MTALQMQVPALDFLLEEHRGKIGTAYPGYKNHCYRVFHLYKALRDEPEDEEKLVIALAFHDLGIWTKNTFDYLEPSKELARSYLVARNKIAWEPEVLAMIENHHKLTPVPPGSAACVETFRRADTTDVLLGWRRYGLPAAWVCALYRAFPDEGFHGLLVQLAWKRLIKEHHCPIPMVRW